MQRVVTAALIAAMLAIGPAAAQVAVQRPQVVIQQQTPESRAMQRRLQLLRSAGITPPPGGLRITTTLSVNAPLVGTAQLSFHDLIAYQPHSPNSGAADLRGPSSHVQIRFMADAGMRYIVDCTVSGVATQFRLHADNAAPVTTSVSDGRVGMVTSTVLAIGQTTLGIRLQSIPRPGSPYPTWTFHQCEIKPVR